MNRKNLKKIIKTIHLLCKQGLAFRGHDESASSNNRGNFMEVLKLLSEDDGDLNIHLIITFLTIICKLFMSMPYPILLRPIIYSTSKNCNVFQHFGPH